MTLIRDGQNDRSNGEVNVLVRIFPFFMRAQGKQLSQIKNNGT